MTNVLQFGRPSVFTKTDSGEHHGLKESEQVRSLLHVSLDVGCDPDCVLVADHELMHRMLLNPVSNALRETPTDGTIRLMAGHAEGCGVTLTVEDSGPGIPAGMRRIFDPMFSIRWFDRVPGRA